MSNITEKELAPILENYKNLIGNYKQDIPEINYNDFELKNLIDKENHEIYEKIKFSKQNHIDDIISEYHASEIDNNRRITTVVIVVMIAGLIFLGIGILGAIFGFLNDFFITTLSGCITEFMGVSIQGLQTISNNSKKKYFEALQKQKMTSDLYRLVEKQKDGGAKTKMIHKLIDGHYNLDKDEEKD